MLDLETSVHLQVVERAVLVEELNRSSVRVITTDRHIDRGLRHFVEDLLIDARGRCFLDQLLVTPLRRAISGPQRNRVSVGVGEHLDLDVARVGEVSLHVDLVAAEVRECFALGGLDRGLHGVGILNHLHAAATTAIGGLDRHRVSVLVAEVENLLRVGDQFGRSGDAEHPYLLGCFSCRDLVAHDFDRGRWRTDERHADIGDRTSEVSVLGEESVAGMYRLGAALANDVQHGVGVEIRLGGRLASQGIGLIGESDVQRITVEFGVDGDRPHPEFLASPNNSNGDFAPVGDQNAGEHPLLVAQDPTVGKVGSV